MAITIESGSFGTITVSGVAEEITLQKLVDGVNSLNDAVSDREDDLDDTFEDLEESTDNLADAQDRMADSASALDKGWEQTKKTMAGFVKATGTFITSISSGSESFTAAYGGFIGPIADLVGSMVRGIGGFIAAATKGAIGLTGFGTVADAASDAIKVAADKIATAISSTIEIGLTVMLEQFDAAWEMFSDVTAAGGLYAGGMKEMVQIQNTLNLNSKEMATITKENAGALARFGGSVAEGTKRLANVTSHQTAYVVGLRDMGITNEEQAEKTIEYMDLLQRTGGLRGKSDEELAAGSREYMKSLKVISAMTGKQADELKKERDERMLNMAYRTKLAQLQATNPEAAKQMEIAMAAVPKGMESAAMKAFVFGNVMNDVGAQMSGMAKPLTTFMQSVANGSATAEQAYIALQQDAKNNREAILQQVNNFGPMYQAMLLDAGGQHAEAIASHMGATVDFLNKGVETSMKDLNDATAPGDSAGLAEANQQLRKLNQDLMLDTMELTGPMIEGMKAVNKMASTAMHGLAKAVEILKNPDQAVKDALLPDEESSPIYKKLSTLWEMNVAAGKGILKLLGIVAETVLDVVIGIATGFQWLGEFFTADIGKKLESLGKVVYDVFHWGIDKLAGIMEWFANPVEKTKEAASEAWSSVKGFFGGSEKVEPKIEPVKPTEVAAAVAVEQAKKPQVVPVPPTPTTESSVERTRKLLDLMNARLEARQKKIDAAQSVMATTSAIPQSAQMSPGEWKKISDKWDSMATRQEDYQRSQMEFNEEFLAGQKKATEAAESQAKTTKTIQRDSR